jgi:NAD(P)-dependent dehydrogenase (short-subunit alcohol dehydrogenase family)
VQINGAIALVTGANRGLGRKLAEQLVERGAAKVYGAARRPETVTTPGVTPIRMDITDPSSVAAAAALTGDVTILINNAGMASTATLLGGTMQDVRAPMESHYYGTLNVTRAFAPQLMANAPTAVLNVVSALSWLHPSVLGAYSAAKAAVWAQTDAVREEFEPHGVSVTALHIGFMDTDMTAEMDAVKTNPAIIAGLALDGVQEGAIEVLTDPMTRQAKAALSQQRIAGLPTTESAWF